MSILSEQLLDYLQNRKKITLSANINPANWGLDRNINKVSMYVDNEGHLLAIPVINVEPSTSGAMRGNFWDRNGVSIVQNYTAGVVAAHGLTVRWTYTVPVNKKFCIQQMALTVRTNVASNASVEIDLQPYGSATYAELFRLIHEGAVDPVYIKYSAQTSQLVALPGDVITGRSSNSAGNTTDLRIHMEGMEFDS